MNDSWICCGFWCNKNFVCVYDVLSLTQKEEMIKRLELVADEECPILTYLGYVKEIEYEIY